jgi:hypothetical protein
MAMGKEEGKMLWNPLLQRYAEEQRSWVKSSMRQNRILKFT